MWSEKDDHQRQEGVQEKLHGFSIPANFLQQFLCRLGIIIGSRDDEHFIQLGETTSGSISRTETGPPDFSTWSIPPMANPREMRRQPGCDH